MYKSAFILISRRIETVDICLKMVHVVAVGEFTFYLFSDDH